MVIDKNTTLMHTFSKGMNTDTSDAYLEEGSYRLANNLRYITNQEENSGELHMIEGAALLTQIPGTNVKVLAATQLRETGVIVTTGAGDNDWQVYTIDNTDLTKLPVKIIDVNNEGLDRVVGHKLSLVVRWEDKENQKLYIADGRGPIITIFLTPNQYKVISDIVAYPQVSFRPPKFAGLIYGNLKAGMYEYSYQYYIKHAQQSEISPSTKLIPLHNGALTVNDADGVEGYEQDAKTNKGIKIEVPVSTTFNRLIIYRIRYAEVGVPPIIETVFDEDMPEVDGEWFSFEDSGKDALNIISLEEYNMMTGIHIIPKTIESMTDYMFASNIENDNPAYKSKEFKNPVTADYEFLVADLIGDTNTNNGFITIKNTSGFGSTIRVKVYDSEGNWKRDDDIVDLSNFISGTIDSSNTYANPYVSYSLKSLRRGETYRYGIILYDKYHNATAVKHLSFNDEDIKVPNASKIPAFSIKNGQLHVHPIGIRFTISNLPSDAVAYEIVRCGKDLSNMSTIMLCVISRPIHKIYELEEADQEYARPESTTSPLTPTGFVTNMDCWYGVNYGQENICTTTAANTAWTIEATWLAANVGLGALGRTEEISGNHKIFQIISPEYSYMQDTVKDMVQKNSLTIEPISYISPYNTSSYNVTCKDLSIVTNTPIITTQVTNIGNECANVVIKTPERTLKSGNTKLLSINTFELTILCYYNNSEHLNLDFSSVGDFKNIYSKQIPNRYGYIKLYHTDDLPGTKPSEIKITSTGFPESLGWDDFATTVENWQLKYIDKTSAIGGKSFCNWVCGGLYSVYKDQDIDGTDNPKQFNQPELEETSPWGGMMGPGGKCFLAAVDNDYLSKTPNNVVMGTFLCNIKQAGGGYNIDAKYSTYRSYGNYFDSSTTSADVFDGDCFIQPFEYISQHKWYHPYLSSGRNAMIAYSIPMETNVNLAYTHGYEFSRHVGEPNITNIQVNPSNVNNSFIQDKPLYAYNSVYSANSTSRTLAAEDSNNDDYFDSKFDYRVFNSMAKSNDETVDNWLKFLPANYIDVDTRYGEITGLRKFVNHLVFWQENAAGLLSVNERVQISDNENMPLTLGTADVLSRYDYMNTSNGMRKDEYADTQSDTTLYWWDHNKHEIIGYSGGTQTVSVSKAKFAQNFLNEMAAKDKLIDKPLLPLLWYDKQFNEVGFTVSDGDAEKKGTLMFGENVGAFTSLYSVKPTAAITFKDSTLLLNENGTIYKWNSLASDGVKGIAGEPIYPYLKYVVNANSVYTKVFDNAEIAGRLYGGGGVRTYLNADPLNKLSFTFKTPLKQTGTITGDKIDNTEYNFRFAIPRDANAQYGGRLRGKTMLAELKSTSNSYDFSLQYIFTKYRISWT